LARKNSHGDSIRAHASLTLLALTVECRMSKPTNDLPMSVANEVKPFGSNVLNKYKGWTPEAIKADLKPSQLPFAMLFEHLRGDYNFGASVRVVNGFNGIGAFYCGRRKMDSRAMVGVQNYTDITFLETFEDVLLLKKRFTLIALETGVEAQIMRTFQYPEGKPILFVVGEEGSGITKEMLSICDHVVYIEMFGSVRSLNASVAVGIAANDFVSKYLNRQQGLK
jgi:tRNA G18 (ribose-2'-O)-methylase SpoU